MGLGEGKSTQGEEGRKDPIKRDVDRVGVPRETIDALIAASGLPTVDKSAFTMVGEERGPRVAIARTKTVSRVFIYMIDVKHRSVVSYTPEERKAMKLGRILGEIDFSRHGVELGMEAFSLCLKAVAAAMSVVTIVPATPPVPAPSESSLPLGDETLDIRLTEHANILDAGSDALDRANDDVL